MIDRVKAAACGDYFKQVKKKGPLLYGWRGIELEHRTFQNEITKFVGVVEGLAITIDRTRIVIDGSLHTFYKGHNGGLFTHQELRQAIELVKLTGIEPCLLKIFKLEFGYNLIVSFPIQSLWQKVVCFGGRPFDAMKSGSRQYGIKRYGTEFTIKFYDKRYQLQLQRQCGHKLNRRTLRVEVEYKRSRILKIPCFLSSLMQASSIKWLQEYLMKRVMRTLFADGIKVVPVEELAALPTRDISLLFAGADPAYWLVQKHKSPEAAKKQLAKFKSLVDNLSQAKPALLQALELAYTRALGESKLVV